MKSYTVISVSIVLAFLAASTSAHDSFMGQDVCDIKYHWHENLASVLRNNVGVDLLNDLRQNVKNVCLDEKAHNALVSMFDGIIDVTTNPNVSQSLGNLFYWARKIMKDPNFRIIWHENMKGMNTTFDNLSVVRQITDTIIGNLGIVLRNPKFDTIFRNVIPKLTKMMNFQKNMYGAAGALFSKPSPVKRSPSRKGQQ